MIKTYLEPLLDNPEEKIKIATQLKELRNKVVFSILMLNSLFILIVFMLQMEKETLHIKWPLNVQADIIYLPQINEVDIHPNPLKLEPINLILAFFFTLILVIQFTGMLFHRAETISHILASTDLDVCSKRMEDINAEANLNKNAVKIARLLQGLKDYKIDKGLDKVERRKTIHILEERKKQRSEFKTLNTAFQERYQSISIDHTDQEKPVLKAIRRFSQNPNTLAALQKRRNTFVEREHNPNSGVSTPTVSRSLYSIKLLDKAFGNSPCGSVRSGAMNTGLDDSTDEYIPSTSTTSAKSVTGKVKFQCEIDNFSSSVRRRLSDISEN